MTTYLYDCFCFCKSFLLCISLCLSHFLAWGVWAGGHGGPRRGNAGARRGDIWWVPAGNQPTIRKVYTWLCSVIKVSQESAFELDYNYITDHFCVKPFKKKLWSSGHQAEMSPFTYSRLRFISIHELCMDTHFSCIGFQWHSTFALHLCPTQTLQLTLR